MGFPESDSQVEEDLSSTDRQNARLAHDQTDLKLIYGTASEKSENAIDMELMRTCGQNFVHNSLSPLSAVSGYLELMEVGLNTEMPAERLNKYREKIEEGINEIGFIIEQMQDLFGYRNENGFDISLMWAIDEVFNKLKQTSKLGSHEIIIRRNHLNIYVHTDPFLIKLVLYNLFLFVLRYSKDQIEVSGFNASDSDGSVCLDFMFKSDRLNNETLSYFQSIAEGHKTGDLHRSDEIGISVSARYAKIMGGEINLLRKSDSDHTLRLKFSR